MTRTYIDVRVAWIARGVRYYVCMLSHDGFAVTIGRLWIGAAWVSR